MSILVLNAGSSSLKFSLFEADSEQLQAEGIVDWSRTPATLTLRDADGSQSRREMALQGQRAAVDRILDELRMVRAANAKLSGAIEAVGHRVVHGGDKYSSAVLITPVVKRGIDELSELAPLHNPVSLDVIDAVEELLPGVPQVAAFDTSFGSTIPDAARIYPIPRTWTREWGLRRFGFHGMSHGYCAARAAEMLKRNDLRLVIAHLGNGASVSAVRSGLCVDTSMGFTPLEGVMMGTRSGTVDPGLLIYLLRNKGVDIDQLDYALNFESGLLGVSGLSSDMREILAASDRHPDARRALDIYIHRLQQTIGAMAASLGGIDGLVFTAGVGENASEIRRRVCEKLGFLGLRIDDAANSVGGLDVDISTKDSHSRVLVIHTREDVAILREVRRVLTRAPSGAQSTAALMSKQESRSMRTNNLTNQTAVKERT